MPNLPSVFNRNSMTSNPMRDLLSIQRRMEMKEKFATFPRRRLLLATRIFKRLPEAQTWHEYCVSTVERFIREIITKSEETVRSL